jgi:hypothetical protein
MPKVLCIIGTVVAALLLLVFGLDLIIKFPFNRVSVVMDVGFVLCTAVLGLLSWLTMREQV